MWKDERNFGLERGGATMIIKAFAADSDKPSIGCFNNHGKRSSLSLSLSLCLSVSPPSLAPTSMFTSHTDLMLSLCQGLTYDQTVVVYRLGKVCKWPARCSRLLSSRRKRTNERTNERMNELGMCNFVVKYPGHGRISCLRKLR